MVTDASIFVGRQPILDRQSHIVAYELLFRDRCGVQENGKLGWLARRDGNPVQSLDDETSPPNLEGVGSDAKVQDQKTAVNGARDLDVRLQEANRDSCYRC